MRRGGIVLFILNLGLSSGLCSPAALPPEEEPRLMIEQDAGWTPVTGVDILEGKNLVSPTGIRTPDYPVPPP
jgi:hypothetical protein